MCPEDCMRNYFVAFTEIIKDWVFLIFLAADFLGYIGSLFGAITFPPVIYILILIVGVILSSVRVVNIKNEKIKSLEVKPQTKLRLALENRQAVNKPVVLENPDRGFSANQLYLVIYNDNNSVDAEDVEIRLAWPPEGFSVIDIWDPTGNNSHLWESIDREKVYSQKERVYAGNKREVGLITIKRFDGDSGKIRYKLFAKNLKPVIDEVTIRKEVDPNYLGL